jgi:hypothetical protein
VKIVVQRLTRRRGATPATWRPYKGRVFPDAEHLSPTIFQGCVYATVQHALFAAMWRLFAPGTFNHIDFYPDGPRRVPTAILRQPALVDLTDRVPAHEPLVLHFVPHEPSHPDLIQLATILAGKSAIWCMLCVGTLVPTRRLQIPQIRAILLHLPTVATTGPGDPFPEGSVEHGWGLTAVREGVHFCRRTVSPVVLPTLSRLRMCLWRRDGTHFALVESSRTGHTCTDEWDADMRRFEAECDGVSPPAGQSHG